VPDYGRIEWITWPSLRQDATGSQGRYPVYAQSHAIQRLHERLPFDPRHYVDELLWASLLEPVIVERQGEDCLIEYRMGNDRLGYLVARELDGKIVIRTFLFLTMQGTPEARLLHGRLRLRRPDIEHHRLDDLRTFMLTDIEADPELLRLFEECGCGHLLTLLREEFKGHRVQGIAAELRQYLRTGRSRPARP
jgi:hypothetical protein